MSLIKLEYTDVINSIEKKKMLEFSKDLLTTNYKKESLFVIKVDGESMQPLIKNKSLVVADLSQTDVTNKDIYLVYHDNKMWIKQASIKEGDICFISINKDYSHLVFKSSESRVVARVILTFTAL